MSASEVGAAFDRICRDRGAETAVGLLADGRTLTFGDLHTRYRACLDAFHRAGIGPGDCIASALGNHPLFFPLLAACLEARVALLPIGEATDAEVAAIVDTGGARALVTDRAWPTGSAGATPLDAGVSLFGLSDAASRPDYGEGVVIKLTSGSTALPKAALAGERALLSDAASIAAAMSIGADDANLAMIPLSHSYAIGNVVMPLLIRGTRAFLRPVFHPRQCLADLRASRATVFPGVPYMFDRLRDALTHEPLPASARLLITAGARIDPSTVEWFHRAAGRKIHSFYGASETGGITFDDSEDLADVVHVGRPLPGVMVDLLPDPDAASGGRVFVRSGAVASGYAGGSGPSPFRNGGFLTSDLGYYSDAGRLVLTGRMSDLINVAGRKVDPAEVERVLVALPQVADARVLGVDCRTRGEELVAFVILAARTDASVTPLALRQACAATLSPYKIPRRFLFVSGWPVNERGKVDRRELDAMARQDAREVMFE